MRVTDIFTPQDMSGLDDAQTKSLAQYLIADGWRDAGGTKCAITAIGPFRVTLP